MEQQSLSHSRNSNSQSTDSHIRPIQAISVSLPTGSQFTAKTMLHLNMDSQVTTPTNSLSL